jgi:hypothetical protein
VRRSVHIAQPHVRNEQFALCSATHIVRSSIMTREGVDMKIMQYQRLFPAKQILS